MNCRRSCQLFGKAIFITNFSNISSSFFNYCLGWISIFMFFIYNLWESDYFLV